jgi:dipeptidase E
MTELLLLSNSSAPGGEFLAHALDLIAEIVPPRSRLLFVPYASGDPARYTAVMQDALRPLGVDVLQARSDAGALEDLAEVDAVFVGGGNTFRLLRALRELGLLEAVRERVTSGLPYLGASAGANVACPTIKTTNDMPIVEVGSLAALGLIPFQINPHYVEPDPESTHMGESRDDRIHEFHEENDVPVLGLREGSWLHVREDRAVLGGLTRGRVFECGREPYDIEPGTDLSALR